MKKINLIVFSLILYLGGFAQNSFPTSNAIWNESIEGDYSTYGLLGDTIFNDTIYSKLYKFNDTILCEENKIRYFGGLRNEGQKLYFKPAMWEHPDILLYDFGAEVNDTVWHNAIMTCPFSPEHYNTYSIIYNIGIKNNIKTYYVHAFMLNNYAFSNEWYEGVGCNKGLLMVVFDQPISQVDPDIYELNCFKHNDTVKYLNSPCNQCFCPSEDDVNIDKVIMEEINIYPNPTEDVLEIEVLENIEIKSIEIYTMDGKLIEKNRYKINTQQLNISNLRAGAYVINIETDGGVYKKSFIKK